MAEVQFNVDAEDRTFLYILYIDSIRAVEGAEMSPSELVCRWYVDDENHCSEKFTIDAQNPACPRYCAFMVVSFNDVNVRGGKQATLTLSVGSDHLAVAFLDLGDFSMEEAFKDEVVQLMTAEGVLAHVELHTAAQKRWSPSHAVKAQEKVYFVQPADDGQAKYLYEHIVQEVAPEGTASAEGVDKAEEMRSHQEAEDRKKKALEDEAAAQKQREVEEQVRRDEEERKRKDVEAQERKRQDEEADRRRREEERSRQRDSEEHESERVKELERQREIDRERQREEQRRKDDEDRQRERQPHEDEEHTRRQKDGEARSREEDEHRHDRGSERARDSPKHSTRREDDATSRRSGGRWAEEDRRRQEEEDRWRQRQRERDEEVRDRKRREEAERWQESGARERRKLEEERERLRQDAKRERARELAERERRAQERRKQTEVTAARLVEGDAGPGDSLSSRAATPGGTGPLSSRAATPVGDSRSRHKTAAESHEPSPRWRGGATSASTGTPQRSPQTTHFEAASMLQNEVTSMAQTTHFVQSLEEHRPVADHSRATKPQHPQSSRAQATSGSQHWPPYMHQAGGTATTLHDVDRGYDSEASEPNPFEVDPLTLEAQEEALAYDQRTSTAPAPAPMPAPVARRTRTVAARTQPNIGTPSRNRMSGQSWQVAARLEHLKAMSSGAGPGASAGLWTLADGDGLGTSQDAPGAEAPGSAAANGCQGSPRWGQRRSPRSSGPSYDRTSSGTRTNEIATQTASGAHVTRSVVAAAFQDAAAYEGHELNSGPSGSTPVAAVEEGLLRLLLLQKQLHVTEEPGGAGHHAALADAAAGLVPRMLQVLESARNVCKSNQAKLANFCKERDMDLERLGGEGPGAYLQAQLSSLDRLHSEYSSLLPSASGRSRSPAVPREDNFHHGFGGLSHGGPGRAHVFQPGSRSGTPARMVGNDGGVLGTWAEPSGLAQSSSHGNLLGSGSPQHWTQASPQLGASQPGLGPSLHESLSASRSNAPLDPGGNGPSVPSLRAGGGSSPPPAKFREGRAHASSPVMPATHGGPAFPSSLSGTLEQHAAWSGTPGSTETRRVEGSRTSTPPRAASPILSKEEGRAELPLRLLALQQVRGVAENAPIPARRTTSRPRSATSRSTAGGAHAGAGSPSPERVGLGAGVIEPVPGKTLTGSRSGSLPRPSSRGRRSDASTARGQLDERPAGSGRLLAPEDKYFKILQNLQAKGAVGARGKFLEGAGFAARDRNDSRAQAFADSAAPSRHEPLSRPWTPLSRSSLASAASRPTHRLAADPESDDSEE